VIIFLNGVDLKPSPPLGSDDRTRYIKIYSLIELKKSKVLEWIKQAAIVKGWK
jgi:hypothetical protein